MPKLCSVCGVTYPDALVFCPADGTTLRSADLREDLVGSVIADRYLVTDVLGEGGMGTVYLARHVRLPQQVAIKVLRKEMLQDPAAVARFNREAANASRIDHDRVARVYDFGETGDGVVYLAMEFVPGTTLKKRLAEGGRMEPGRVVELVRQVAEGLDAAHRLGIVHRDLKPDNIMVIPDPDGEHRRERVKVVDFGIAKAFGDGSADGAVLTRTGFVVGTPEFMSPEQLLGGSLDARSDVYALALVAYQCLTGELPFPTNTPDGGMAARLVTPPRPLHIVQPTVRWPTPVQETLDRGLSRDPAGRYASAGAFAKALGEAVALWRETAEQPTSIAAWGPGEVPEAPRGTASTRAASPAATSYAPPTSAETPATAQPTVAVGTRRTPLLVAGLAAVLVGSGGLGALVMRARRPAATAQTARADTARADSARASTAALSSTQTPAVSAPVPPAASPVRNALPNAAPNAVPHTPPNAVPNAASNAPTVARQAIDSMARTFDLSRGVGAEEAQAAARTAAPAIRGLMMRLTSADDSTWAALKLTVALVLTDDQRGACDALRVARRLARSAEQKRAVTTHESLVGTCGE